MPHPPKLSDLESIVAMCQRAIMEKDNEVNPHMHQLGRDIFLDERRTLETAHYMLGATLEYYLVNPDEACGLADFARGMIAVYGIIIDEKLIPEPNVRFEQTRPI